MDPFLIKMDEFFVYLQEFPAEQYHIIIRGSPDIQRLEDFHDGIIGSSTDPMIQGVCQGCIRDSCLFGKLKCTGTESPL